MKKILLLSALILPMASFAQTNKPITMQDGSLQFVYGSGQNTIICAPLQLCDVALQAGEHVNQINVGDPRFMIEPAMTGVTPNQQIHLIIKPQDVDLNSSLVISTNKRTYHLRLKSHRSQFMPLVSFIYPNEVKKKWELIQQIQTVEKIKNTLPETHEYLGNLNFDYRIKGHAKFKPIRVYNDGIKTIIEMPNTLTQQESPILLILKNNGFFHKPDTVMVNYRLKGRRYIVDTVFDQAMLVIGVGALQEKIIITRGQHA